MAETEHPAATLNRIRRRNAPLTTRLADAGTGGGWEITARAVPLDTPTEIFPGFVETIRPGALIPREGGVKLFSEHRDVIGVVTATREEDGALMIDARISDTQIGRDVRQLIADGALTQMSIGFMPESGGQTVTYTDDGIDVAVTRATLYEVSVVPFPAYEDTAITDQRSVTIEREKMAETAAIDKLDDAIGGISADVRALRDRIDRVETAQVTEPHPLAKYRSYGDYIKNAPEGLAFRDVTSSPHTRGALPGRHRHQGRAVRAAARLARTPPSQNGSQKEGHQLAGVHARRADAGPDRPVLRLQGRLADRRRIHGGHSGGHRDHDR